MKSKKIDYIDLPADWESNKYSFSPEKTKELRALEIIEIKLNEIIDVINSSTKLES